MALLGKDPRVHSRTWEQFMAKSYQENRETYSYKEVNAANNLSELGSGFFPSSASRWGHRLTDTFSSVQSLSHAWLFATPWTVACQASLSISNSRSLLKVMSIELMMPSNHLILCRPLLLLPSVFPRIRVFPNSNLQAMLRAWAETRFSHTWIPDP